jgi:hypothetical protein
MLKSLLISLVESNVRLYLFLCGKKLKEIPEDATTNREKEDSLIP